MKKKTTFMVSNTLYQSYTEFVKELGLRSNTWLNQLIPDYVELLKKVEPLNDMSSALLSTEQNRNEVVQISLNLNEELISSINATCKKKNFPRNLFVEHCLKSATEILSIAAVYLSGSTISNEGNPFELNVPEEDIRNLVAALGKTR